LILTPYLLGARVQLGEGAKHRSPIHTRYTYPADRGIGVS